MASAPTTANGHGAAPAHVADPPRNVPLASASDQIALAWVTSGRYAAPPMPSDGNGSCFNQSTVSAD